MMRFRGTKECCLRAGTAGGRSSRRGSGNERSRNRDTSGGSTLADKSQDRVKKLRACGCATGSSACFTTGTSTGTRLASSGRRLEDGPFAVEIGDLERELNFLDLTLELANVGTDDECPGGSVELANITVCNTGTVWVIVVSSGTAI